MDGAVIDITQLGCPPLADIILPGISCTFACHKKSRHVCVLRMAYSLSQWLNLYILSLQFANCPNQPAYHWCFPDGGFKSSYILLQRARDKGLHLPEWRPQTTGEDWNFSWSCDIQWTTVIHSADIQEKYMQEWIARTRFPASYPVSLLWTVYTHHESEHSIVSKQKRLVTSNGFTECLHR